MTENFTTHEIERYESWVLQGPKPRMMCWRGPAGIYQTDQTESWSKKEYGNDPHRVKSQEWLCWRRPAAIYPKPKVSHQSRGAEKCGHWFCRAQNQKWLCCEGQQQVTTPWKKSWSVASRESTASHESEVSTPHWWLAENRVAEESPLLKPLPSRLVKTQQTEKT
jgi:hypothetical protein